ncbi:MAG: STAS domain-containing protein [Terriglobia bacterium]
MPLEMKEREAGPVTLLAVRGRLTVGEGSEALEGKLQDLIASGKRSLLLDCSQATAIDSHGIKALVRGVTSAEKRGGKLKLLKLTPRVRESLDITRLLTVIEAFDDEATALGSFSS